MVKNMLGEKDVYSDIDKYRKELFNEIRTAIDKSQYIFIEAPTGVGKTTLSLLAIISYLKKGYRVIYLSRSHTLSNKVINILKLIKKQSDLTNLVFINIRGKDAVCPEKIEDSNNNIIYCLRFGLKFYCRYYHNLISNFGEIEQMIKKIISKETIDRVFEIAITRNICPYYLFREIASSAAVIVANYFYIFGGNYENNIYELLKINPKKSILIIDEAHNIPSYVYDITTIKIDLDDVLNTVNYSNELKKIIEELLNIINSWATLNSYNTLNVQYMLKLYNIYNFLTNYILSNKKIINIEYIYKLLIFIDTFIKNPSKYIIYRHKKKIIIYLKDISEYIKKKISPFYKVIFISATLYPIKKLIKNKLTNVYNICWTKLPRNMRISVTIIKGLTTKYRNRSITLYENYCDFLHKIYKKFGGPIIVFAASKEIINGLLTSCKKTLSIKLINMETTREMHINKDAVYLFSQRGRWREGIDIHSNVVVVFGLSYPNITIETIIKYKALFGSEYKDAILKESILTAIQAVGRTLRNIGNYYIYLVDTRFLWKKSILSMPIWFRKNIKIINYTDLI